MAAGLSGNKREAAASPAANGRKTRVAGAARITGRGFYSLVDTAHGGGASGEGVEGSGGGGCPPALFSHSPTAEVM